MILSAADARALLKVYDPIPVAWTSRDGTRRDDDGNEIDERQLEPWTMALGPFGSWPCTVRDADKSFAEHCEWVAGESFRLGAVVIWRQGWGYAADAKKTAAKQSA